MVAVGFNTLCYDAERGRKTSGIKPSAQINGWIKLKKNILILLLINLITVKLFSENIIYELGPQMDDSIVFAAFYNIDGSTTNSTKTLEKLASELQNSKLNINVIIAILDNDIPNLPKTIPIDLHKNTKILIEKIYTKKNSVVFVIEDGEEDKIKLTCGAGKKTTPSWLLKDLLTILKEQNLKIDFSANKLILHRLNIIYNDKILQEFLDSEIPSIKISTGKNIIQSLKIILNTYSAKGISKKWDRHYNIINLFGYKVLGEKLLVILLIIITFSELFYTFIVSLVYGRSRDRHIRDLLKLWKAPVVFFIFNIISLYIAEYFVGFIFYLRFGNIASIELFPITAIFCKLLFTILISFLFLNLTVSYLPKNSFIYGYLTNLICFINIFIFSIIEFSFSFILFQIYLLVFISSQFKKVYIQIIFILFNFGLIAYNFFPILFEANNLIKIVFYINNFAAAMFFVPYTLMINRVISRIKTDNPKLKLNNKIFYTLMSVIFLLSATFIFIQPSFIKPETSNLFLIYKTGKDKNHVVSVSDLIEQKIEDDSFRFLDKIKADDFLKVSSALENYLERSIGEINVYPLKEAAVINILITRSDGFPIYEANTDFISNSTGKSVIFLSSLNTKDTFSVKFSTEKNADLNIKVTAWFYGEQINTDNPRIKNANFIFEAVKEFNLQHKNGS